jgi:hypothetical protein
VARRGGFPASQGASRRLLSILKAAPEASVAGAVKGTRAQPDPPDMPTATTTTTEDRVAAAASLEAST